jgi:hypothetical protein
MMEKDKLRKADIFSGSLVVLLGLFIISQAFGMPMKDSWGGVQNVWFVSPALFPLLVGGMLSFLGVCLISTAFKSVGTDGIRSVFSFLASKDFRAFLRHPLVIRFYGIVFNLLIFVFLMVPRIDFFPAAILFLLVCFFMFYFGDHAHLVKVFGFTVCTSLLLCLFFFLGLGEKLAGVTRFGADWLVLLFIPAHCLVAGTSVKKDLEIKRKYRLSIIIALIAPLTIGIIFKYFLLVPMPYEGLIVQLLDSIWYADLWS